MLAEPRAELRVATLMENLDIAGAVVLFLLLVGAAIYAARRIRGQEMRESEQRRPQDKGKHVEL